MNMLARFTGAALLAAALLALAPKAGAQMAAGPNVAGPAHAVSGPPSPVSTSAAADPASDDLAERMSLDRQEQAALPAPAPRTPHVVERAPAAPQAPAGTPLSGVAGLGLSAAFLALGVVFLASQRKHLHLILKRPLAGSAKGAPRRASNDPAATRAAETLAAAQRVAQDARTRPAAGAPPSTETESLRRLATELQQTITELRSERARWEKEWEQREMQWGRLLKGMEFRGVREDAPSAPIAELPMALAELEQDSLPSLNDPADASSGNSGVLARVEQMLAQGIPAEEISRRLRVGLREIQWMMRLGAMESRS